MTDWKGNEIKEGHIIVIVRTKPFFTAARFGFLDFSNPSKGFEQVGETYKTPEYIWEPRWDMEVVSLDGKLYYKSNNTYVDISMLNFFKQDSDIICIKGISDNEQEYFLEHFKS